MNSPITAVETLIACVFIFFVAQFRNNVGRAEFVTVLTIPLCAVLAIYATGFEHIILVIGYILLLLAQFWTTEMYRWLDTNAGDICLVFSFSLCFVAVLDYKSNGYRLETTLFSLGSLLFIILTTYYVWKKTRTLQRNT
jgi:hypothetical protein